MISTFNLRGGDKMSSNAKALRDYKVDKGLEEHACRVVIISDDSKLIEEIISYTSIVPSISVYSLSAAAFSKHLLEQSQEMIPIIDWASVTEKNCAIFSEVVHHFSDCFMVVHTLAQRVELKKAYPEIHWVPSDNMSLIIRPLAVCKKQLASNEPSKPVQNSLTVKEQTIIKLLEQGYSNTDIADELNRSISTIKSHIYNIYRKLGVKNRVQALNRIKGN